MDYLVFTGDLVDARYITQKARESPDIERPLIHKKLLEDSFLRAREYLNYLSSRLGVPNKDVLLCCGNHDVNRAVLPCLEVPCVCRSDVKTNTESFREWDKARGERKALSALMERCRKERRPGTNYAIVYGSNAEALDHLKEACAQIMDRPPIAEYPVGCVISINTGPNMIGILYRT